MTLRAGALPRNPAHFPGGTPLDRSLETELALAAEALRLLSSWHQNAAPLPDLMEPSNLRAALAEISDAPAPVIAAAAARAYAAWRPGC